MLRSFAVVLVFAAVSLMAQQGPAPHGLAPLKNRTVFAVKLKSELRSDKARVDDAIALETLYDVKDKDTGAVLMPKGTPLIGRITVAQSAGGGNSQARLAFVVDSTSGVRAYLDGVPDVVDVYSGPGAGFKQNPWTQTGMQTGTTPQLEGPKTVDGQQVPTGKPIKDVSLDKAKNQLVAQGREIKIPKNARIWLTIRQSQYLAYMPCESLPEISVWKEPSSTESVDTLKCGEQVMVLTHPEGDQVKIRTPRNKEGYLNVYLLTPKP